MILVLFEPPITRVETTMFSLKTNNLEAYSVVKVWVDGHGWRPGGVHVVKEMSGLLYRSET